MSKHIVTAPAVQVIAGARSHFLETGAILPDGVDEATVTRLVNEKLIEPIEIEDPEAAAKAAAEAKADADAKAKADADAKAKADADAKAKADADAKAKVAAAAADKK